jgi:hypothetical protein
MKTPSTGNFQPPEDKDGGSRADYPDGPSQTRTSVKGEPSPRLPHERDESSDSAARAPDSFMKTAHADAVSNKAPTDKSAETNAAYEHLRGGIPGQERDKPE